MPELPEVENLRLSLVPHLVGATISNARLLRADVCESFTAKPSGIARAEPTPRALLRGTTIESLVRHGKQMAIVAADGRAMCIHLGMSGRVTWRQNGTKEPVPAHTHATWTLADRRGELLFTDPRRFGGIWTYPSLAALTEHRWSQLGLDGLTTDIAQLSSRLVASLQASQRPIKACLLDQSVVAGVGNIYADEALFASGILPNRPSDALGEADVVRLAVAVRSILSQAVEAGGSTLRDYVDSDGLPGRAQLLHAVYGRGGEPCTTCGTALQTGTLAQRTTVWCTTCQR